MMDLQVGGAESVRDRQLRKDAEHRARLEADPFVLAMKAAFPGAEIVGVRRLEADAPQALDDEAATEE